MERLINHLSNPDHGQNQEHKEQHEEQAGEELGDRKRRPRDAGEPEHRGNETDDEENQRELKHGTLLATDLARSVPAVNSSGKAEAMTEPQTFKLLTGWQRAYVLSAAQYVRDIALRTPHDERARAVYAGLLEVLEPTRRVVREHREQRQTLRATGSMWDQRSGGERRLADRRALGGRPSDGVERRTAERRSGRDRRAS